MWSLIGTVNKCMSSAAGKMDWFPLLTCMHLFIYYNLVFDSSTFLGLKNIVDINTYFSDAHKTFKTTMCPPPPQKKTLFLTYPYKDVWVTHCYFKTQKIKLSTHQLSNYILHIKLYNLKMIHMYTIVVVSRFYLPK